MYISLLKEMFEKMTVGKNAALIPEYYHPDFLLYTNEQVMGYADFLSAHQEIYATPITYSLSYDEETFIEKGEKVAGRMWITLEKPDKAPQKLEIILIAQFKEKKIHRLWELTYPDWSAPDSLVSIE